MGHGFAVGGLCALLAGIALGCGDLEATVEAQPLLGPNAALKGDKDDDDVPGPPCQPTAGGPYWLEEGQTLRLEVKCADGWVGRSRIHLKSLPEGAEYDKKTGILTWTPRLDQAGVYLLELKAPKQQSGTVKVGVADNWKHPDNVPLSDVSLYTEEFGLPVFHLQGAKELNPDTHSPVVVTYRGHSYSASAKLRGSSSLAFPKNSYTVKFDKDDPFNEPALGGSFTGRRSLVLLNNFNDNSYLRARLGFDVWGRLSPQAIQVKTFSAVVFLDGVYHGLYTVVDHVNDDLMAAHGRNKDGNLYKAETGSANFRLVDQFGRPKRYLHAGFEKKEGQPKEGEPGAFADLEAFVYFVATASDEAFRDQGPQLFHQRDYEDWWAFITLLVALDSDAKNAYHYHDPQGSLWRYAPWDLDGSFGQTWRTQRLKPTAALNTGSDNELFRRLLAEPTFSVPLKARLRAALSAELAVPLLHAQLEALAQELGPSARRDESKWMAQYRSFPLWSHRTDFTTFDQEVAYIRQWLVLRWAFLDARLAGSTDGPEEPEEPEPTEPEEPEAPEAAPR